MTNATNDSLARAIDSLGAVEVGPEFYGPRIYAVKMPGGRYRVGNGSALIFAAKVAPSGSGVARDKMVLMPSWWSPEQREAWRVTGYGYDLSMRYRTQGEALAAPCDYPQTFDGTGQPKRTARRITADLETGAEVPA